MKRKNKDWDKNHLVTQVSPTEWLDIWWHGKIVQINGKGKIRVKKKSKTN